MTRLEKLYVSLAVTVIASFPLLFAFSTGWLVQVIIVVSLTKALIVWMRTNLRFPTDPHKLLPPYLLMGAALMFHIIEEYMADFGGAIGALVASPWDRDGFTLTFVFFMPLLWIGGMIAVARRHPLGGFFAWFLSIGMVFGEWTHLGVFPLLVGGRYDYFPGMWTALLPMIPALWSIAVMVKDARVQRDGDASYAREARSATP